MSHTLLASAALALTHCHALACCAEAKGRYQDEEDELEDYFRAKSAGVARGSTPLSPTPRCCRHSRRICV
jgi:hypothetical protein